MVECIKAFNMNPATYDVAPHVTIQPQQHQFLTTQPPHHVIFDPKKLQQFILREVESPAVKKQWPRPILHPEPAVPVPGPAHVGRRWREYQGSRDWAGLLNPLDSSLRGEILRYGNFNEAAYLAFEFDPWSPVYGTCKFSKRTLLEDSGFPGTGYRVTRNLRATSGIQAPEWAVPAQSMQSRWIGFVAVCEDKGEIARLGRRDVVIALRGTATWLEWLENLRATLTPVPGVENYDYDDDEPPMVETGFLSLYTSGGPESLRDSIREEVGRILSVYRDEPLSITLTGHSLGAALATLAAYDIKTTFKDDALHVTVMSLAGPQVGNRSFRSLVEDRGVKILRIVNPHDLITKVPGIVIDNDNRDDNNNQHYPQDTFPDHPPTGSVGFGLGFEFGIGIGSGFSVGLKFEFGSGFWLNWIQKRVEDTQTHWAYAEVGCELKLKCLEHKYLLDLITCHDLKTYLQLVMGLSSKCPLRATARKFVAPNFTPHQLPAA